MTLATEIVARIRQNPAHKVLGLKKDSPIGVRSFIVQKASIDERNPREVVCIANTDDIDGADEVVVPGGADTSYFFAPGQKKVFVDHRYDFASNVGVVRVASPYPSNKEHRSWRLRIHLYDGMKNTMADDVLSVIQQAGLGLSIGFLAEDWGNPTADEASRYATRGMIPRCVVRRWKWLEVSFTAMPCNVACQTLAMHSSKSFTPDIRKLVHDGKVRKSAIEALSCGPTRLVCAARTSVKTPA